MASTSLVVLFLITTFVTRQARAHPYGPHSSNPLEGVPFYVDKIFQTNLRSSIRSAPYKDRPYLRAIRNIPTAVWLSSKVNIAETSCEPGTDNNAKCALSAASHQNPPPLVTFIVYNLPNRDCAAKASAGEICCSYQKNRKCDYLDNSNKCEHGLYEYKSDFLDKLAEFVKEYCYKVPMAFVIEPDSLANLVTNLDNPKCSNPATKAAYRLGIRYAVQKLKKTCPRAPIYIDAAHGGWMGWKSNSEGFVKEIKGLQIASKLRGFALNVANYQEMGTLCPKVGTCLPSSSTSNHPCCKHDSCGLSKQYNPGHTALNYAASLKATCAQFIPSMDAHFLIDTARNGAAEPRSSCGNWCNIRGAGVGQFPTTTTANKSMIDAYMWLKTPGESDGCTETLPDGGGRCPRFDVSCSSQDSIGSRYGEPRAPEAGKWFDFQIRMLARNSRVTLRKRKYTPGMTKCPESKIKTKQAESDDDDDDAELVSCS